MLAMRNKFTALLLASIIVWTTFSYYLIFHHAATPKEDKDSLVSRLSSLEKEVNDLLLLNKQLINDLGTNKIQLDKHPPPKQNSLEKPGKEENLKLDLHSTVTNKAPLSKNSDLETLQLLPTEKTLSDGSPVIAVLVISCNRITVQRCLDQLIKFRRNKKQFPILVSQDCSHPQTTDIIRKYKKEVIHIQQPDQSEIDVPLKEKKFSGYFKIARHYGWALNETFFKFGFETVIVVEDDLDVAPDFYEYFLGTYPILKADPSLWCVSAWNDNGKANLINPNGPHLLYRTDFFPGLGWMLTRKLWQELSPKWPKSYWDDWIRQPEQRKDRACIRPELSRTRTFGRIGVSNGMFFDKHLQFIKLNDQVVPFSSMNLTYLMKENYDIAFVNEVYKSEVITLSELKTNKITAVESVRIPYYTRQSYKISAKTIGLMDDFKSGVPRTGYRGVVTFYYNGHRVHLAPSASWSGYDTTWS